MLIFNANTADEARVASPAIAALLARDDGGTDILLTGGQKISVKPSIAAVRAAMTIIPRPREGKPADIVVREIEPSSK